MQLIAVRYTFNRRDRTTIILGGKRETRKNTFSINQHCARSACALVTAFLTAKKVKTFSHEIKKRNAGIIRQIVGLVVYFYGHRFAP